MRPRIRTIKPEIWQDERIGDLGHGARLLFIGLITMADDEGRLRELPAAILGHIFPYDDVSTKRLSGWLREVEQSGMVVRYAAGGKRYIAFRNWSRHQKVDRPSDSELPAPDFDDGSSNGSVNDRRGIVDSFDDRSRSPRGGADPIRSDPDPIRSSRGVDARELFDYWREQCQHPDSKPSKDRMAKIEARLRDGYTVEQIRLAIDGAAVGAFVNEAGKRFDDIELICRTGSKLESFIGRPATSPTNLVAGRRESPSEMLIAITGGKA